MRLNCCFRAHSTRRKCAISSGGAATTHYAGTIVDLFAEAGVRLVADEINREFPLCPGQTGEYFSHFIYHGPSWATAMRATRSNRRQLLGVTSALFWPMKKGTRSRGNTGRFVQYFEQKCRLPVTARLHRYKSLARRYFIPPVTSVWYTPVSGDRRQWPSIAIWGVVLPRIADCCREKSPV